MTPNLGTAILAGHGTRESTGEGPFGVKAFRNAVRPKCAIRDRTHRVDTGGVAATRLAGEPTEAGPAGAVVEVVEGNHQVPLDLSSAAAPQSGGGL